jgi:hypothetical protein
MSLLGLFLFAMVTNISQQQLLDVLNTASTLYNLSDGNLPYSTGFSSGFQNFAQDFTQDPYPSILPSFQIQPSPVDLLLPTNDPSYDNFFSISPVLSPLPNNQMGSQSVTSEPFIMILQKLLQFISAGRVTNDNADDSGSRLGRLKERISNLMNRSKKPILDVEEKEKEQTKQTPNRTGLYIKCTQCKVEKNPVCTTTGKYFENICLAECVGYFGANSSDCPNNKPNNNSSNDSSKDSSNSSQTQIPLINCGCPTRFEPVCGKNRQTYDNECLMKCKKVEFYKTGAC